MPVAYAHTAEEANGKPLPDGMVFCFEIWFMGTRRPRRVGGPIPRRGRRGSSSSQNKRPCNWSVRVGDRYRAIGRFIGNEFLWEWIGSHADYDKRF